MLFRKVTNDELEHIARLVAHDKDWPVFMAWLERNAEDAAFAARAPNGTAHQNGMAYALKELASYLQSIPQEVEQRQHAKRTKHSMLGTLTQRPY